MKEAQEIPGAPRRKRRWKRRLIAGAAVAASLPLLGLLAFHVAVAVWPYPEGARVRPRASTVIEDREGAMLGIYASADGQWHLPLEHEAISRHLMDAIVAVEDGRFYQHHGVDWRSVVGAAWENVCSFRARRGGSTISMQVHRLRAGLPRTLWGKFEQAVRAEQLEKELSKEEILVEYLNRAPFGGNLVGAGAASWRYFNKPCSMLSLGEAALLAGLPQSPGRFRPDRHPEAARKRRDHVLDRMLACGMISQQQRDEAGAEATVAGWRRLPQMTTASPQADGLAPTLLALARAPVWAGQRVRTTVSARLQKQLAAAAWEELEWRDAADIDAVAAVLLDTASGECLARVSLCRRGSEVDLTQSLRSTGSTLKPFIYAAAFENGLVTPQSMVEDSPRVWPQYRPENFDHEYRGRLSAGEALAESRNIPALVLLSRLGVEYAAGTMQAAGLRALGRNSGRYGLSLAIGGAEATPLEMANAYATLARGGTYKVAPLVMDAARGTGQRASGGRACLAQWACWQALEACSAAERTAAVCPAAARSHVAWKTGTSSGYRDAWCAATTRKYTLVLWLGNVDGHGADGLVGVEAAAPLALRLVAALDPQGSAWPQAEEMKPKTSVAVRPVARRKLVIVSPSDGLEVVYRTDSPAEEQRVMLEARLGDRSDEQVWWFVDGEPLGSAAAGERQWWAPLPGSHRVTASTAKGESALVRVRVR